MDDYLRNYILLAVLGFILEARCDRRMMTPRRDGDSKLARLKHGKLKRFFESTCEMEMKSDAEPRRMAMRSMGNLVLNLGLTASRVN